MNNKKDYGYPVGFYNDLHPDFSINFQMNRFYNWTNDIDMLSEMKSVSASITTYEEYIETFLNLGRKALTVGKKLTAANYMRGAEFYLPAYHPQKQNIRRELLSLMKEHYNIDESLHYVIPYENAFLSAYRFTSENPKGTVVLFGGFDGYIEELFKLCFTFKDAGYNLICFDGPGQGVVLEDYNIPLTHEWEKPVKTVLDYFDLSDVTLIGLSLGGYLVVRAAAYESRVKRVIAFDILMDFYTVILNAAGSEHSEKLHEMMQSNDADHINNVLDTLSEKNPMLQWGLMQGMHITGSKTPYEFIKKMTFYNTKDISSLVTQDVLLMAGQEDHYVPVEQFFEQAKVLKNVRSLTTRLFTKKEHAQNHCQLGNIGLALDVILNWIQERQSVTGSR